MKIFSVYSVPSVVRRYVRPNLWFQNLRVLRALRGKKMCFCESLKIRGSKISVPSVVRKCVRSSKTNSSISVLSVSSVVKKKVLSVF